MCQKCFVVLIIFYQCMGDFQYQCNISVYVRCYLFYFIVKEIDGFRLYWINVDQFFFVVMQCRKVRKFLFIGCILCNFQCIEWVSILQYYDIVMFQYQWLIGLLLINFIIIYDIRYDRLCCVGRIIFQMFGIIVCQCYIVL